MDCHPSPFFLSTSCFYGSIYSGFSSFITYGIAAIEQLRSLDRSQAVSNAVVAAQAARWADCATASGTGRR